jgi:HEAT repeat protein
LRDRIHGFVAGLIALAATVGCGGEERGPILAGGREVKSWIADLRDRKPQVRRQAVLKLGNVGNADPAAVRALTEALNDSDALVRREAILAVAKLREPSAAILGRLKVLSENDRDAAVRDYARKALKRFE